MEKNILEHDMNSISILIDFVEGRINVTTFKNEFNNNIFLQNTLRCDPLYPNGRTYSEKFSERPTSAGHYLEMKNWTTLGDQLNIWGAIESFLSRYNYPFIPTKCYENQFNFLLDIQPNWLDMGLNEEFLIDNVINKIPNNLKSKVEKIKWCKEKIKELFKYDKSPPRWVQSPEWPIVNGKPLIFRGQSKEKKDDERVWFYFYDPDTGKETIIEQFY